MKCIAFVVMLLLLSFIPASYAILGDVDAGVLPGDMLYFFDLFLERFELFFSFGPENKVQTLISIAQERKLEFETLDPDDRDRYSSALMMRQDVCLEKAKSIALESGLDDSFVSDNFDRFDDESLWDVAEESEDAIVAPEEDNVSGLVDMLSEEEDEAEVIQSEVPELSEIQETACLAADAGYTCYTKLPELGLVTIEECCAALGVCCG
ncbi:MAG: DUF5667 domain-containing protein [archaeon]|nr:DUF5667 domain-containing protein [archaeon]